MTTHLLTFRIHPSKLHVGDDCILNDSENQRLFCGYGTHSTRYI